MSTWLGQHYHPFDAISTGLGNIIHPFDAIFLLFRKLDKVADHVTWSQRLPSFLNNKKIASNEKWSWWGGEAGWAWHPFCLSNYSRNAWDLPVRGIVSTPTLLRVTKSEMDATALRYAKRDTPWELSFLKTMAPESSESVTILLWTRRKWCVGFCDATIFCKNFARWLQKIASCDVLVSWDDTIFCNNFARWLQKIVSCDVLVSWDDLL